MIVDPQAGTSLAMAIDVRSLFVLSMVAVSPTTAADALYEAELRVGYGIARGGSGEMTTTRRSPLTIAALGSIAFEADPPLSAYGGLVVETLDRSAAGTSGGVKLSRGRLRLAAGAVWIFAPYTLWGASATAGTCLRVASALCVCADAQLTAYFAGTDLPDGQAVTQIQGVIGVVSRW